MRFKLIVFSACALSMLIGVGIGFYFLSNSTKIYVNFALTEKLLVLSAVIGNYNAAPGAPGQLRSAVCNQIEVESQEMERWFVESTDFFNPPKTRDLLFDRAATLCDFGAEAPAYVAQ